ncbi:MAG TPA: hypothetical protein VMH30_06895 [Verrucomicrobiae bacterium]|nr:hypothetical protein [Verrucomicrobiae bacterium]
MPSLTEGQITIGGPCKINDPNGVIYTEGDVVLTPKPKWRAVPSAVLGAQDDVLVDGWWEIEFTPKSVWTSAYRAVVLPGAYYNYVCAGAPLIGAANRTVNLWGADGNGFDITRGIITEMPTVYIGLGESVYGKCKMIAFLGNGNQLTDGNAFLVPNTTAWNQGDYPTTHQEQLGTLAWGALTDWSNVFAEKGFKLSHEFKTNPVLQGNITIDRKIESYRGMLSFLPQEPTTADLLSALNYVIGSRRSASANNAVVTASGMSMTLYSVAVRQLAFHFDNKLNRHGELQLVTAMTSPSTARMAFS